MDPYLRCLLSQRPLSAAEERRFALLSVAGDPTAREALVLAGMRAVVQRALLFGLRGEALRDGVQAGAVGLIRAVDRFDPDRGARLNTYAWPWIGSALAAGLRAEAGSDEQRPVPDQDHHAELDLVGLPQDLAELVALRFGLSSDAPPLSRRRVGERLGLTESQVRTREAEAMRQLRGRLARIGHRASPQCEVHPP